MVTACFIIYARFYPQVTQRHILEIPLVKPVNNCSWEEKKLSKYKHGRINPKGVGKRKWLTKH